MDGLGTQAGMATLSGFDPLSFSPYLWLSDTGSNLATWEDLSGNGRDAVQNNVSLQPSIATTNGMQVRRFASDWMVTSAYGGTESFELFIVTQNIPHSGEYVIAGWARSYENPNPGGHFVSTRDAKLKSRSNGGSHTGSLSGYDTTSAVVKPSDTPTVISQTARSTFTASKLEVDAGGYQTEGTFTNDTGLFTKVATPMGIGAFNGGDFKMGAGDICEILHYPALTETERLQVEAYLLNKWAI